MRSDHNIDQEEVEDQVASKIKDLQSVLIMREDAWIIVFGWSFEVFGLGDW